MNDARTRKIHVRTRSDLRHNVQYMCIYSTANSSMWGSLRLTPANHWAGQEPCAPANHSCIREWWTITNHAQVQTKKTGPPCNHSPLQPVTMVWVLPITSILAEYTIQTVSVASVLQWWLNYPCDRWLSS